MKISMQPFPLLPTIGTFPPEQIIGRQQEIVNLLRILSTQSISLEEMRRMGKTLLVKKLEHFCNSEQLPPEFKKGQFQAKYFSFQGKRNLGEVIDALHTGLREFKSWHNIDFIKTYDFIRKIFGAPQVAVSGATFSVNLPEYQKSWKEIFFQTLDEIASIQEKKDGMLILIFDELPIMLWDWYTSKKHEDAIELLDILRERRQELERRGIRFIYCGSIGIKVVLARFKAELNYTGEPTNDMLEFNLKPFSKADSDFLCECFFLSNFNVSDSDKAACLEAIYKLSNGLPYYVSQLFTVLLQEFNYEVNLSNIEAAYNMLLNETKHHNAFRQLVDRLQIYYSRKKCEDMMSVLNHLAKQDDFLNEKEIFSAVAIDSGDALNECLYTLLNDHYLERKITENNRTYRFRYPIFQAWWKINKA